MCSCPSRTLHVSWAIAIPGYAAQVSVRAGSVIAHLASLNKDGPNRTFVRTAANVFFEPKLHVFCAAAKVRFKEAGYRSFGQNLSIASRFVFKHLLNW